MTTVMPGENVAVELPKSSQPTLLKNPNTQNTQNVAKSPMDRQATAGSRHWKKYVDKPKVVYPKSPVITKVVPAPVSLSKGCVAVQKLAATPTSYINPERLMDDIAEIYAARDRVLMALDQLDCASRFAGTPIRSTSARERFHHLLSVIREAEAAARTAWQSELAAAGQLTPQLRKLVVAAGVADARTIDSLVTKDGDEFSVNEYDELLVVLDGALIDSGDKTAIAAEDYAASFFAGVDRAKLQHLVSALSIWTSSNYRDTEKGKHAQRVLSELRSLFERAVEHDDVFSRYPTFGAKLETLDVKTLNMLLLTDSQTVRRSPASLVNDPGAGALIGISSTALARLAKQILVDPSSMHPTLYDPGSDGSPSARMTILRLLEADAGRNGDALAQYLAPINASLPAMEAASKVLLALLAPNSNRHSPLTASPAEEALSANIMKSFFVQTFDHGTPEQVRAAAEVLELTIANTAKLGPATKPMLAALATGFAGTMTHPLTAGQLLLAAANDNGIAAGEAQRLAGIEGLRPGRSDLRSFLKAVASEPLAVRTIFAALGPMLRTVALAQKGLPTGPTVIDGWGFIQGAMLSKFDGDAQSLRALIDGSSAWLTAGFATVGALTSGPVGSMAAGALGSGLLQTIGSLVRTPLGNTGEVANSEESIREQLKLVYITSTYQWLRPDTQDRIAKCLVNLPFLGVRPIVGFSTGRIVITNQNELLEEDLVLTYGAIRSAVAKSDLTSSPDEVAINTFANSASSTVGVTRRVNDFG